MPGYKGAFDCSRCPMNGDPTAGRACPAWHELMMTNVATGEERLVKDCLFRVLPSILIEVVKASNRPAAAIESMRNEVVRRIDDAANPYQARLIGGGEDGERRQQPALDRRGQ